MNGFVCFRFDSDWLLKETKYPFGGAAFDLVQYRYISPKLMRIVLRDGGACNTVIYLQMNWHGDFYRGYGTDGGRVDTQQGDEWGNWPSTPLACNAPHAYHWNAQWGYQFFADLGAPNGGNPPLGLYYAHGRWYNPEVGLWLSPDEKGEYFYGSGQNPADWVWAQLRRVLALLEALKSQAYYQTCGNTVNSSPLCTMQPATSPSDLAKEVNRWLLGRPTLGPPLDPAELQAIERAISAAEKLRAVRGLTSNYSWGNPETLQGHFEDHKEDFGAKSKEEYAAMASDFLIRSQAEGLPIKVDDNGVIRVYEPATNTFGAYNPDGTTRTFLKPSSPTYWNRQPGSEPWWAWPDE